MARTKIDSRLIATGGVKRDAIASGSIEIGHLNFIKTEGGGPAWGGVIADGDIVALHDTSADTVRGIEAGDLKAYINSGSAVAGTSGSIQFNHNGSLGGLLDWKTDGHNLTGSNGRQLIFQAENVSGSNVQVWSPAQGELRVVSHGPGSGVNSSINLIARGLGGGNLPCWINIGSGSNREIEYNVGSTTQTTGHQFLAKGTHFMTLWHDVASDDAAQIQSEVGELGIRLKTVDNGGNYYATVVNITSSHGQGESGFDTNTNNAYAFVIGDNSGTNLSGACLAIGSATSSVIYNSGTPDKPILTVKSKGTSNTRGTVALDAQALNFKIAGTNYFTMGVKSGVGVIGHGKSGVAIGTTGAFIDGDGRGSIRFDSNNSADTVTIYSGSTAIFGGRNADMQVRNATSKILLGGGTTYYVGGAANAVASVYDVVGSNSVSGATGNFHDLTGDDAVFGGATVNSLTASNGVMLGTAVTDDLSILGGLITDLVPQNDSKVDLGTSTKQFAEAHIDTGHIDTVTATNVDGILGANTAAAATVTSLSATGDVDLGNATSDTITCTGQFDSDLIPSTDSARDLGTSAKQWAEAHIDTGNIDTIVATALTASFAKITSLDVDTIVSRTVTKDSLEIKDNLIIAGVSGSKGGDYVGAGFQLGGKVGVQGTGSSPLMSLTLGTRVAATPGDALLVNVGGQSGASFVSGSDTMAAVGTAGMRFGVTGSVSGSLLQAKRAELGHISTGKVSGVKLVGSTSVSGASGTFHTATADKVVAGQVTITSLTASGGMMIGNALADDIAIVGGLITDLVPQNDSKVDLGTSAKQFAEAHIDTGHIDTVTATNVDGILGANTAAAATVTTLSATGDVDLGNATSDTITATGRFDSDLVPSTDSARDLGTSALQWAELHVDAGYIDALHGTAIVTVDNIQTGSVTAPQIGSLAVTKAKLHQDIVINKTDANGGITFTSGRLSVGWRKDIFVRADGSNISGSVPTSGMFASKAVPTPYLTASLGAQPMSGSLMVYLNGVLLHGDHITHMPDNQSPGADYHLSTGSANAYKVYLHDDLALDSDDVLTVTYLSGSGTNS